MKIPTSVRDSYSSQKSNYELLKEYVDNTINTNKEPGWHYVSRVKEVESYALKLETGRCADPSCLEDFFACTLVVENLSAISKAEKLIKNRFELHERRPKDDSLTSKPPDSFRFDDTRLYVRWKDDRLVRPTGLDGLLFEVQIKTYLAHAWSIATHDLSYKTDEISWAKERIAYQIKAMLEHAEISILEAQKLAKSASLKKTDPLSKRVSAIIQLLNDLWPPELLPRDKKRLAENTNELIRAVGIDVESLRKILLEETHLGRGAKTLNLSPYCSIIRSLLNQAFDKMEKYLTGPDRKFKVFIPREVELPSSLQSSQLRNAVVSG
ncbi:MAG: hypothetical protein AB7W37_16565 [Syntrophobacteraceae bacterium]